MQEVGISEQQFLHACSSFSSSKTLQVNHTTSLDYWRYNAAQTRRRLFIAPSLIVSMTDLTSFSLLTTVINLSIFFPLFCKVIETLLGIFSFAVGAIV